MLCDTLIDRLPAHICRSQAALQAPQSIDPQTDSPVSMEDDFALFSIRNTCHASGLILVDASWARLYTLRLALL
jgi:ribosome biogenesis protein Tsr3